MVSRLLMAVIISILLSAAASAAEVAALPFAVFTENVVAYYPQLKAAHSHVEIALAQEMQAKAGFWPSLDLSAGYKVSEDPVDVFGMLLRQERFTSSDFDLKRLNTPGRHQDLAVGAHLEMPLFDAMQTIGRTRSARASVKAAQAEEAFTGMEALLVAQDAYMNALTLEKLSSVINEVQKSAADDLQKAKDLKDKGMILGADYFSARVMFGELVRTRNEVARQQKAMMALLNILMGEPVDRLWTLTDTIDDVKVPRNDPAMLIEQAFSRRPDLAALEARIKASDAEVSRARSMAWPALNAFGDVTNNRNKIDAPGGDNYTVGLKVDMPLFDPAYEGRVKAAKALKGQLGYDRQHLQDTIKRDIVQEAARYDTLSDNIGVLKGMRDDAREAVDLVVPLYSEGRKSIADLLEVRRVYVQTVQEYNKAMLGMWLSRARLLFLSGQLNRDEMKKLAEGAGL
ncbi:MAG: TolC family protein [Candidatus Omnitrophica bacterium]|nr:TolC family protein [Candidatus Omnitrophota bacterium]